MRTKRYGHFWMSGLLAAALPAPLAAQATESTTNISIDLNGRYDSNVARSSDAVAEQRGLERSDVIFSPTVSVDIERVFGRNSAFVRGQLGYVIHARNNVLDRERIAIGAGLDLAIGPCRASPEAQLRRGQTDLADIALIGETVSTDFRNTETVQFYRSELICGDAAGFQPFADIEYETARNSNVIRDRAEYDTLRYSGGLQYSSPALGDFRLFVGREELDFNQRPLASGTDGYSIMRYGADYSRDLGTRLTVKASINLTDLNPDNPATDGFSGLNWSLGATLLLADRIQVEGSLGKEISNSLASDSTYVVLQPYELRVRYAANERLRFEAGAYLARRRFEYPLSAPAGAIDRETRRIYDVGANYRLRERLTFRLGAGYEERNANGTLFDYRGAFATAGLSVSF